MRITGFLLSAVLVLSVGGPTGRAWAQSPDANATNQQIAVEPGDTRDEVTFSTENGPQYIVVRDFRVTEIQPTGKEDEYALTLLALTLRGEPDQRVMGGILFEIDGKSTLVPFEQGGVGDVIVKVRPELNEVVLRAVDSNVTHRVPVPGRGRMPWLIGGGVAVAVLGYLLWRRMQLRADA